MGTVITRDGLTIHYEVFPGPLPVLLVHGFASNAELTWKQTGWISALAAAGRGAITVDLRGHGASDKPSDPGAYSPERLAADIRSVLDVEHVGAVDIIAYSMGCQVVRALVDNHAGHVRSLVLGGVGSTELFATWDIAAVRSFLVDGRAVDRGVAAFLTAALSAPGADRVVLAACIEGMAAHVVTSIPPVRTLVIAGDKDEVASDAESFATVLGAQFATIPGRNHWNALSARSFKARSIAFMTESIKSLEPLTYP